MAPRVASPTAGTLIPRLTRRPSQPGSNRPLLLLPNDSNRRKTMILKDIAVPTQDFARRGAAFEVLWNPNNFEWDEDQYREVQNQIQAGSSAPFLWSTGTRKSGIQSGDRIYLFFVGTANRGLIASGHARSEIQLLPHWDEARNDEAPYVNVTWDALLDPEELLHWDAIRDNDVDFPKVFMAGGRKIDSLQAEELETLWQEHLEQIARGTSEPSSGQPVEKGYKYYLTKHRIHQQRFRALLLQHYEAQCVVCSLDEVTILEAAHLIPDAEGGLPTAENGRLMCPNHHKAFDSHLFELDEDDNVIWREGIKEF